MLRGPENNRILRSLLRCASRSDRTSSCIDCPFHNHTIGEIKTNRLPCFCQSDRRRYTDCGGESFMTRKPASGRSRTNHPAGVRKRILDATADAFQKRGYHSTSTHDIVRAAGVTAGALHHHFPTKKALALNVIQERVAQAVDKHWLEPVRSARGAEEGIRTAFEQIASALDRSRTILGCPLNNLALELCAAD